MLYDYKCKKCGFEDEYILPVEHRTPQHCGVFMERQYSAPQIIFKGSGFYETDYKRNKSAYDQSKIDERDY